MKSIREKDCVIDGISSWVECLSMKKTGIKDNDHYFHYHEYIEVLYATSGEGTALINGDHCRFSVGDLVVINSGIPHTVASESQIEYICIKFLPQILYANDRSFPEFKYVMPFVSQNSYYQIFNNTQFPELDIHNLITEIMDEWNRKEISCELVIRANILKLFSAIFRYWYKNNLMPSGANLSVEIKTAINYIKENFDTVTEAEVSKRCGFSYSHFSFMFQKATGKNFTQYLTSVRLNEAKKLLVSTDKSITSIALLCGFSSASHFISVFKRYNNITPKQFRMTAKIK